MKKILKINLICGIMFFIFCIFSKANAASASISANKTTVKPGEKVTITIPINAGAWNVNVSGAVSKKIVGDSGDGNNTSRRETISFTPSKEGSYTINLGGDVTDGSTNKTSNVGGNITIVAANSGSSNNNSGKSKNSTKTKNKTNENNSTDSNNTQTKTEEPTFKETSKTEYSTGNINIRKSYNSDSDKIGTLKSGDNITVIGEGNNGWTKVSYNGQTGYIKTSLLSPEKAEKTSDGPVLKKLEITPEGLTPVFDPKTTTYELNVGTDVEKLDIKATPEDSKSKISITGNDKLEVGDNKVTITVTSDDGSKTEYTINVKKGETNTPSSLGLSSLRIEGYTLSPKFSSNVYKYKINVLDPNVVNLNVIAEANDQNAKVEITGNKGLTQGQNIITITVTSEDGNDKAVYTITVNKDSNVATTNSDQKDKIIYCAIIVAVIIIALIIIIAIKKHNKNKKENSFAGNDNIDDYSDLYGYTSRKTDNNLDNNLDEENVSETDFLKQNPKVRISEDNDNNLQNNDNKPQNNDNISTNNSENIQQINNNVTNVENTDNEQTNVNSYDNHNSQNKLFDYDNSTISNTFNDYQSKNENLEQNRNENQISDDSYEGLFGTYSDDDEINSNYRSSEYKYKGGRRYKGKHSK